MTEIQRLIYFLESGKRKEISMSEYISLQKKGQKWLDSPYSKTKNF
ncbi:hypothetical protein [Enterococcus faecium]